MRWPERVEVIEVAPRDGLQRERRIIPTEQKVELVHRLAAAGFRRIEVTSFVRPDVLPQLADAEEVMRRIERRPGTTYRALVPNAVGARRAIAAGTDEMLGLITASPTYNRKNQNMSIERNLAVMEEVLALGQEAGTPVTIALSMTFFCPYEGVTPFERVLAIIAHVYKAGCRSLYVADSAGMADPREVYHRVSTIRDRWPDLDVAVHLHNTNGLATANALAALQAGVTTFEGAVCGLGGGIVMPEDMAVGNVASEDLVQMFETMGIDTGIDLEMLLDTARWVQEVLGLPCRSHAGRGGTRASVLAMGRKAASAGPHPGSSPSGLPG